MWWVTRKNDHVKKVKRSHSIVIMITSKRENDLVKMWKYHITWKLLSESVKLSRDSFVELPRFFFLGWQQSTSERFLDVCWKLDGQDFRFKCENCSCAIGSLYDFGAHLCLQHRFKENTTCLQIIWLLQWKCKKLQPGFNQGCFILAFPRLSLFFFVGLMNSYTGGCIKWDADLYMLILMGKKFQMTEHVLHRKFKQVLKQN